MYGRGEQCLAGPRARAGAGGSGGGGSGKKRKRKNKWADDLNCLESDDEDGDDQAKMKKLGRSIGRCNALECEEEFDFFDGVAMTAGSLNHCSPRHQPHFQPQDPTEIIE